MQQADDNKEGESAAIKSLLQEVLANLLEKKTKKEKGTEKEHANLREGKKEKKLVRTCFFIRL